MLPDVDMDALGFDLPPPSANPSSRPSNIDFNEGLTPLELDMNPLEDPVSPPRLELRTDSER